ncbi:MAG: 30S ribosomal protein S2 [Candidatus Aenigmatarchaeota archaeon]
MAFEEYLSAGVHIGMKQTVKDMRKFVYKIRPDGLAVLNVSLIDERLNIAANFLTKFNNIIVTSRKMVGQKPAIKFAEAVGAKSFIGRFLPGTVTNPSFPGYSEADVVIVTDPLVDKQAVTEAVKMRIPVIALCDTFNETKNIDLVIPCNNKGKKALATIYWALAKKILLAKGDIKSEDEFKLKSSDFEAQ